MSIVDRFLDSFEYTVGETVAICLAFLAFFGAIYLMHVNYDSTRNQQWEIIERSIEEAGGDSGEMLIYRDGEVIENWTVNMGGAQRGHTARPSVD